MLLSCAALSFCEVSQQKLTGDESSLSSDTQVTESTLTSSGSAGSSSLSSSSSSSSLSSSSSSTTASPSPYSFAYNTADVSGNQIVRQEAGDANGAVRGRYGYRDADGLYRTVEYIADANGFRAAIRSNEPGLGNSADVNGIPASVFLQTETTPTKVASKVASASLARLRVAQNTLATALPTTTTTRRPVAVSTAAPTARPSILASLTPLSATKGGATAPVGIAVARVTPVAAARANSVRQSVRLPSTLRLVSSQIVPLQRLVPLTTSTTTTTTTTTTEAPATVSQQFLSGQQDDQQVKSLDEQVESDSLGSDQQVQTDQQSASDDQQEQAKFVQPAQPIQPQTVQQKQTDQQTDSSPAQPEVNTDNDEAGESLPSTPVQPQIQIQTQIQPQVPPQVQIQPQVQTQIQPEIRETQPEAQPETQPDIQPEIQSEIQPQIQTQIPIQPLPPPTTGPVAHENPLLVRFLDEDLTYDSLEFPHIEPQPRTIAVQTDDHPLSRLYRIVPLPHHESLRLHQAGANMMYLTSAQSYGPNYQNY